MVDQSIKKLTPWFWQCGQVTEVSKKSRFNKAGQKQTKE